MKNKDGRVMFEIQVKYGEIESRKVLIKTFNSFEELGVWIANNYDEVKIIDLIQFEE